MNGRGARHTYDENDAGDSTTSVECACICTQNLDNTSNDCDLENEIGDATVTSMHERVMWVSHLLKIVNIRQIDRQFVNVLQLVDASRVYMQSYKAPNMMLE